jgi:hypothetical protein
VRIVRGLVTSVARREVADPDQRLAWLLVLAAIPSASRASPSSTSSAST